MASLVRGLIEYIGIDNCIREDIKNFRQLNFESTFSVPHKKPDIDDIVKVYGKVELIKYEIIETAVGKSLEGQEVTGYKILISGDINYKIQYVVNEATKSVHIFNQCIPFCCYVGLPKKFNTGSYINTVALIEDISVEKVDERCIYSNITLLFVVDISH